MEDFVVYTVGVTSGVVHDATTEAIMASILAIGFPILTFMIGILVGRK